MSATTTQLLSSSKFCNLHYDTTPVKSASANVSFYTKNRKCQILSCDTFALQMRDMMSEGSYGTPRWLNNQKI